MNDEKDGSNIVEFGKRVVTEQLNPPVGGSNVNPPLGVEVATLDKSNLIPGPRVKCSCGCTYFVMKTIIRKLINKETNEISKGEIFPCEILACERCGKELMSLE